MERIQKILSASGIASRRTAERMIADGRVTVNGAVATLGQCADPTCDRILLDGVPIPTGEKPVYIMLHKPRGFVTTLSDERGRRTAAELVADCGVRVYPVGRLDMSSEGLLLFTNDGEFTKIVTHPAHRIPKTYLVWVTGYTDAGFERLCRPMWLDGYALRAPQVRRRRVSGAQAQLEIAITEGRNRQVRRMCQQVGMHVNRLRRIAEGNLSLADLPVGKWRYLTEDEVRNLRDMDGKREKL